MILSQPNGLILFVALYSFVIPAPAQLNDVVQSQIMIDKALLEMLVCPACKQPLEYRQSPESLKCTQCHRVYPIEDNIPVMLIDKAKVEP